MPREDRSQSFFVDQKGNPHISRHGCIYEHHVPKYKSKSTGKSVKSQQADRYYEQLKKLKAPDTNHHQSIEKRLCDSHCVCHQSFIPIPYDYADSASRNSLSKPTETDDISLSDTAILNESLSKDPHNVDNWLRFINLQSAGSAFDSGVTHSSVIIERKLAIVERALQKNQTNRQLQLLRLSLGAEVWLPEKLQKEWQQLIFVHNTDIAVWRCYIDQMRRRSTVAFSVDKVVAIYQKCFSTFFNIMSGRSTVKTISADAVYELCGEIIDWWGHTGGNAGYRCQICSPICATFSPSPATRSAPPRPGRRRSSTISSAPHNRDRDRRDRCSTIRCCNRSSSSGSRIRRCSGRPTRVDGSIRALTMA